MSYRITYDEDAEGRPILRYSGDAQMLVDACADEARARREGQGDPKALKNDMRRTLSLDPVVMMDIAIKNGLDYFDPAVFEIAAGRDYSRFRCIDDKLMWKSRGRKRIIVL